MNIIDKINTLRREKEAIILAHNYQSVAIQDIADFRGDSLQLSIQAQQTKAKIIVFCGVRFMAETASILNPDTKVLLPVADAGCPMADMITVEQLRQFKQEHPGAPVVCYVNSSVAVKAESDVCCTSSNAVKVLKSFPEDQTILFVPDQHLGTWAARQSSRNVIVWDGFCPVHHWGFEKRQIKNLKKKYPEYSLIAHPECDDDIISEADEVLSTGGMMNYVPEHDNIIIATDAAFTDYLKHIYPEKKLVALNTKARCRNMRKITLQSIVAALEQEQVYISIPKEMADKAIKSLNRMLELPH
jgi:quinolinate synthase